MTFDRETLWYAAEIESTIAGIAPTIGMPLTGLSVVEQIEAFTALAQKLGATPATTTDEQAFNDAIASVAAASIRYSTPHPGSSTLIVVGPPSAEA
ncbi:hypothetical protein HT102_01145 [Hoyosella sp. G463]|uniref:Uncharacterized protein n=1 Tax=Lolliginicoccus lacisalsi TaxID=2742202 RepID=A0A927JA27_9ACTN|nr:hypothetical protein [Lolliginicoccus lacisalsi]MBD8505095.1 hypothetical protein [Lolliginicoccus lacisalsi]